MQNQVTTRRRQVRILRTFLAAAVIGAGITSVAGSHESVPDTTNDAIMTQPEPTGIPALDDPANTEWPVGLPSGEYARDANGAVYVVDMEKAGKVLAGRLGPGEDAEGNDLMWSPADYLDELIAGGAVEAIPQGDQRLAKFCPTNTLKTCELLKEP